MKTVDLNIIEQRTRRLVIRPMELTDFEVWRKAYATMLPPQNEWDRGRRSNLTLKDFKQVLKSQRDLREADDFYDLGVFKKSGELVGEISAMEVSRGVSHSAFLGYCIYNNYWNKGYGKEAVTGMFQLCFRKLGLHRLEAGIQPRNLRSHRLAKALKMRREGIKHRMVYLSGGWRDLVIYAITTEDLGLKWKGPITTRLR